MLAPRVNAAGRMSTPDIATRLLLATGDAMGEEARGAGAAAQRREPQAPAGRSRPGRAGAEGDRDRPGRRRPQRARRRRRGLAPRRDRHRRVEAGRRLSQAGDRALDRRRRRPRILPQHSGLRHARRARALRRPVREVRRPPPGRRADDGGGAGARVPRADQRPRGRGPGTGSAAPAPAHRRPAHAPIASRTI